MRVHALSLLDDVLGDSESGRGGEFQAALKAISEEGRGVAVLIGNGDPRSLAAMAARGEDAWMPDEELRDYGLGAQILIDLGVKEMILMHNTRHTFVGLEGYGLTVAGQRPVSGNES